MKRNTHNTVYRDESRAFYLAGAFLAVSFISYVYFVSVSIADVVMRKEVDTQIAALATTISQLEGEYIEMQHSLSNDVASLKGFVAIESKVFIDTTAETLVLRGN